jgi:hypothetical protein
MAVLHATPMGKIGGSALPHSHLPELEYLKSVNRVGPPRDPQLLFVLMAQSWDYFTPIAHFAISCLFRLRRNGVKGSVASKI